MFSGAHVVISTTDADADRAFFRDVIGFRSVDAGDGWLFFALPESEAAFHPADSNGHHELYLMCDDVEAFISQMKEKGINCDEQKNVGWGILTAFTLPGGGKIGVYQPRHERP
jgi:catechol 2,3-dioxygenase-like lactoylglutathione lyase family enzyme